jgi:hypothetical protein
MTRWIVVTASVAALSLAACGEDEPNEPAAGAEVTESAAEAEPVSNACPIDGCEIAITGAEASGDEIVVTWQANFVPDVSKNHIHIYWDIYEADQVSSDAEDRGVKQGEWVPTDDVPTYETESAVSTANRGDSTTLCVTAGDRDHAVIDSEIVDCYDVSDLL